MRQALHIFLKDIHHLRLEICLVLALAATLAWQHADQWTQIVFALAAAYLIARSIQDEPIPGDRQFWITRPYRWKSLLAAKVLFILVFVNLPSLSAQVYLLSRAGFPLAHNWDGLVWSQLLNFAVVWLPVAALAALTSSVFSFNNSALVIVAVTFVLQQVAIMRTADTHGVGFSRLRGAGAWPVGVQWMWYSLAVLELIAIALSVLYVQYKTRRTPFTRAFAIGAVALVILIDFSLPASWALGLQTRLLPARNYAGSLSFSLPATVQTPPGVGKSSRSLVSLPLAVSGIPQDDELAIDSASLDFQSPDANHLRASVNGANQRPAAAGSAVLEIPFFVSSSFFSSEHDRPLKLRASIYITLFGDPGAKTIPLQKQPVEIADGLRCELSIFSRFACASAFRWPARLVYVQTGAAVGSLGQLISYSPFPAGLNLDDDIQAHWTTDVSPFVSAATVIVKRPIAHFRRDIEIDDIQFIDRMPSGQ
ncbi:MAG TPA: hypothetical protein VIY69_15900 [Candidatus Acidoferrales bacterium]